MPDDNGEIFPCHLAEIYNEEKNLDLGLAGDDSKNKFNKNSRLKIH